MNKRILITSGDPSGIGPEVILKSLTTHLYPHLTIIGSDELYRQQYGDLYTKHRVCVVNENYSIDSTDPEALHFINIQHKQPIQLGNSNIASANLAKQYLDVACRQLKSGYSKILITGPVCKQSMTHVIHQFMGHTEYLAEQFHVQDVRMLMLSKMMKIVLVTIHIPINQISGLLTTYKIVKTIELTHQFLKQYQPKQSIRIAVAGLNPHAGENGHLGREEIDIIKPAIKIARKAKLNVEGPFPPDTIFRQYEHYDAIIAMYHDQGLIPFKLLYFDKGINVTLGLPFTRLSVDHGTALDIAGKNKATPGSIIYALNWAIKLNYLN